MVQKKMTEETGSTTATNFTLSNIIALLYKEGFGHPKIGILPFRGFFNLLDNVTTLHVSVEKGDFNLVIHVDVLEGGEIYKKEGIAISLEQQGSNTLMWVCAPERSAFKEQIRQVLQITEEKTRE